MIRKTLMITASALLAAPVAAQEFERGERNTSFEPAFDAQFRAPLEPSGFDLTQTKIAGGLVHPWGLAVLPGDQGYLVTERPGRLRHIASDGTVSDPIEGLPEIFAEEQGGLLDVKLGPNFADSRRVYFTYSKPVEGGSVTAAAYGVLNEDMTALSNVTDIFVQEPAVTDPMHYGSRIVFDGEGHAFVTTGERFTMENRDLAQELDTTFGKVVRVTLDGETPQDNPFVGQEGAIDTIWSYGHRNVQGALYNDGQLWTIEHGPQGGDELNLTEAGKNYGWPVVSYGEQYGGGEIGSGQASMEGMEQPDYFWDPVIAPGDMIVYDGEMFPDWQGDVFIAALVRHGLVRLELEDGTVQAEESLARDLGRVRDVDVADDGSLLVLTDLDDGALVRLSASGS
ncbi:PQQ-dependent sugar dehydrogenase [Citreimonas salinaria]|uniref:Glucose/arabinose dehydrogenase, beta-propeller fold n=1 Tax=Citreimonas salinaria TaxID=321339 RepID=A0A1H3GJ59_9RHOB|nr:PQQ-dependent sugar dehydrogenase [Citreimonas salinaria]SDY02688.1 Glucose/arabinose dehydrogenase, beta-propeller fold [Citreimonas salinaria]